MKAYLESAAVCPILSGSPAVYADLAPPRLFQSSILVVASAATTIGLILLGFYIARRLRHRDNKKK
jgi:hypothetical protein